MDFAVSRAVGRFHAAAGARVALRNSWVGVLVFVFVVGMAPSPLALLRATARSVAAAETSPWALMGLALVGAALAALAAPLVLAGDSGWSRSLPASRAACRRATIAALVLVQAPVLVFASCCVLAVALAPGLHLAALKLLTVALIAVGVAVIAFEGRMHHQVRHERRHAERRIPLHIAWRAVSWRAPLRTLSGAVPLAGGWLFIANNELDSAAVASPARICGVIAVVVVLAGIANALHLRRPVWGWERSLPSPSERRVLNDAGFLVVWTAPVLLAVAMLDVGAAVAVAAVSPLFALVAAAAIRCAGARQTSAAGEVVALGVVVVTGLAFTPWTIVACVALTPVALAFAARRERRRSATQWLELHHRAEGDALSWSAR